MKVVETYGLDEIREKVACPQLGDDHYGEWGALRLEQRIVIAELVGKVKYLDRVCRAMHNAHSKAQDFEYKEELEELEHEDND